METAIQLDHITKKFRLYYDRPTTLKERLVRGSKGAYRDFLALEDVSLQVKKGSTIGLIGKNGCGKSTLLKIINRTMFPNKGTLQVNGKVSSLIELGAGFHPELSGRENIYTNASIFGLTQAEIEKRIPHIIEFSELEEFIDNPIRTYSSGMYARLAFSVAIHVDAEILLVDEILGVGDLNFQAKCANKIYEMRRSGTTIVLVTHDMSSIDRLCDYVIWLDHGKLVDQGDPKEMLQAYMAFMANEQDERTKSEEKAQEKRNKAVGGQNTLPEPPVSGGNYIALSSITEMGDHFGNGDVLFTDMKLLNDQNADKRSFNYGEQMTLLLDYICQNPTIQNSVNIGIEIYTSQGMLIYTVNSVRDGLSCISLMEKGQISILLDPITLLPGEYTVGVAIADTGETISYDHYHNIAKFKIYSSTQELGIVHLPHRYCVDGNWYNCKEL